MSTQPIATDVYQPQGDRDQLGELEPDLDDGVDSPTAAETLDAGYSPPEAPRACGRFGTTSEDQLMGENLDERLRQEIPDNAPDDDDFLDESAEWGISSGHRRSGRIVMADDDVHGFDVGIDGGAASAEEAAMHVISDDD